jgi:hypothetical protein
MDELNALLSITSGKPHETNSVKRFDGSPYGLGVEKAKNFENVCRLYSVHNCETARVLVCSLPSIKCQGDA